MASYFLIWKQFTCHVVLSLFLLTKSFIQTHNDTKLPKFMSHFPWLIYRLNIITFNHFMRLVFLWPEKASRLSFVLQNFISKLYISKLDGLMSQRKKITYSSQTYIKLITAIKVRNHSSKGFCWSNPIDSFLVLISLGFFP